MAKRLFKYYEILGISKDASHDDIRQAYRRLARERHPDVNHAPDATEQFKLVNKAYQVLGDPQKRADYDASPAECPDCYTYLVIQTIELLFRCRGVNP